MNSNNSKQQLLKLYFDENIETDKYVNNIPKDSKITAPHPLFRASAYRICKEKLDIPTFKRKILYVNKDGRYFAISGNPYLPTIKTRDYLIPLLIFSKAIEGYKDYCVEIDFDIYLKAINEGYVNDYKTRHFICNTLATMGFNFETNMFSRDENNVVFFPLITSVEMKGCSFRVFFNSRYAEVEKLICSTPKFVHYQEINNPTAKTIYLSLITRLNDNYAYFDSKQDSVKQVNLWYWTLDELLEVCNFEHWKSLPKKYFNSKIKSTLLKGIKDLIGNCNNNNFFNCFLSKSNPKLNPNFSNVSINSNFIISNLDKADPTNLHTFYVFTRGSRIIQDYPFDSQKVTKKISEK